MQKRPDFESEVRYIYEDTANSLAADRATRSLPVFVAEIFFIGGWLIALIKAASSEPGPKNWPNIEVHSIAFSGMYLWITGAVVLGSVIGASQTEGSIPRLLQGFESDLADVQGKLARHSSVIHCKEMKWCRSGIERAINGGLNNWKPRKWKTHQRFSSISNWNMSAFVTSALAMLSASYITAIVLSYYVPPHGLGCRHIPETVM